MATMKGRFGWRSANRGGEVGRGIGRAAATGAGWAVNHYPRLRALMCLAWWLTRAGTASHFYHAARTGPTTLKTFI
jgi:hypothetical protein